MKQHRLALLTVTLAALFVLFAAPSAQAQSFCEQCHAAGNCCNPHKVLCVSCGDTRTFDSLRSGEELTTTGVLPPLFEAAEAGFCEECHAAGNCCNPHKVLCVSCGDTLQEKGDATREQVSLFGAPTSCMTTTLAALR